MCRTWCSHGMNACGEKLQIWTLNRLYRWSLFIQGLYISKSGSTLVFWIHTWPLPEGKGIVLWPLWRAFWSLEGHHIFACWLWKSHFQFPLGDFFFWPFTVFWGWESPPGTFIGPQTQKAIQRGQICFKGRLHYLKCSLVVPPDTKAPPSYSNNSKWGW